MAVPLKVVSGKVGAIVTTYGKDARIREDASARIHAQQGTDFLPDTIQPAGVYIDAVPSALNHLVDLGGGITSESGVNVTT